EGEPRRYTLGQDVQAGVGDHEERVPRSETQRKYPGRAVQDAAEQLGRHTQSHECLRRAGRRRLQPQKLTAELEQTQIRRAAEIRNPALVLLVTESVNET